VSKSIKLDGFEIDGFPGVTWEKSSTSTPGTLDDCTVMAALPNGEVAIGDTKTRTATVFTRSEIAAWVKGAKAGEFDHLM
jgi:phosphoribosyl-AMP cyclohydrolase